MNQWRPTELELPAHAYAAVGGASRSESAHLQDTAAGGRAFRMLDTGQPPKSAARIKFVKRPHTRRVYAYLVWHHQRRRELLLGEAVLSSREANLTAAWRTVHEYGLLTVEGRDRWPSSRQNRLD